VQLIAEGAPLLLLPFPFFQFVVDVIYFLPVSSDSSLLTLLQIVFSSSVSPECIAPESCYSFFLIMHHGGDDYGQDGDGGGRCRG
jgi:hypothetical protein